MDEQRKVDSQLRVLHRWGPELDSLQQSHQETEAKWMLEVKMRPLSRGRVQIAKKGRVIPIIVAMN